MSELSDFLECGFDAVETMLGTKSLVIDGGTAVACVAGTEKVSEDYESGGFAEGKQVEVTVSGEVWSAAYTADLDSYLGTVATLDGVSWRVEHIDYHEGLVALDLVGAEE